MARSRRDEAPVLSSDSALAQEGKELRETKSTERISKDEVKAWEVYLRQLREQAKGIQETAARGAVEHPMLAFGVTFLVGMAFGAALARCKH